jgi:S1-C subfamily serine protease
VKRTVRPAAFLSALSALVVLGLGAPARAGDEPPGNPEASNRIENAVVQVFATQVAPDPTRPWSKEPPREVTGSGVVIEGKRILTNAHVVLYASQIEVQPNRSGDKLSAKVKAIAPGIDLALLELEDARFFDTHPPLSRATALPAVRDQVLAYGFPTGGSTLSITKGIVSRIEFVPYGSHVSGLRVQVDAAINPGNSGGPVVARDQMIGLVFSQLGGAQNIGYIIPTEEIELFLADVADGTYDGKPSLLDEMQTLENDALRAFLRLESGVQGVVVHAIDSPDPKYPLREWDVITRIGDTPIDNQGRVEIAGGLRVNFRYLIQKLAKEGNVPLTIRRSGQQLAVRVPVPARRPRLVSNLEGAYPSYFTFGPIVFSPVTNQLIFAMSGRGPRGGAAAAGWVGTTVTMRMLDPPAFPGEELVAISSPLFPHKLSKGYSNPMGRIVSAVNGTPVKHFRHLVELLRDCRDDYVVLSLAGRFGEGLVFPRKEAAAATEAILTDNGIRAQGSPDAMAVWNGARAGR